MTFSEWVSQVPEELTGDVLWKIEAYRLGLFLADLAWQDASRLNEDRRTLAVADQVFRATGKISSNIAEGYSRGSVKDRCRFYEYALGSTRESRDWYFKARHLLGEEVVGHRIDLCTQILKLTLRMLVNERKNQKNFSG